MGSNNRISNLNALLAGNFCNHSRWDIFFDDSLTLPGREVTHLAIVTVIGEPDLRADHKNLLVEADYAAVIADVAVHDGPENGELLVTVERAQRGKEDGHSNVEEDVLTVFMLEDLAEHLP
jgi:hypothetical protein